jgi:hypothetical protein
MYSANCLPQGAYPFNRPLSGLQLDQAPQRYKARREKKKK